MNVNSIAARVTITNDATLHMRQDELQRFVLSRLSDEISKEIANRMTITKTDDIVTDTTSYTGTLTLSTHNISTGSIYMGANGISSSGYSQINLRVVEYTKNGKVSRVELQKYNDEDDSWSKIPRVQIEE